MPHPARPVPETQPPDTLTNPLVADDEVLIQLNNRIVEDEENEEPNGDTDEEEFIDDEEYMSGRGSSRGSSQSSHGSGRGRGRAALSSEHTLSPSPTTSTPDTSQVAPITWDGQKGYDPDNNDCTQAISDVIELMLNEPWLNYSEIPEDVQKRWFEKWAEGFTWPAAESKQIRKAFDYRAGRRYQQIMRVLHGGELQRLKFANDPGFKKRQASSKANRASSKGGCLHTGGSATIPKTRAKMTRSLDRSATDAEVFRATHMRKRDRSIVEKRADDLLTEFSANLEQATQQAQEEGDESAAIIDPDVVWRQTLSEPCKNRVYGAGGFFTSSLRRSGYGGSSASASSTHTGPAAPEVVDLREQSLQTQGHMLQQHIDELRTLKDTLAERDARAEEHLRRMEEMQRQMAAFYNPLRPGSSAAAGGSGSSTAPPLPPRPLPRHPAPEDGNDDDDYEDA
ncbi:hypothetical protein PIB30_074375 [Stylosanthes scabra]|uniref:Uncharacterized protein n=1 Tax=Stylosanthes scabra TaxID=79078 RepID=A0ABU6RPJ2_9FABA|nr:hypothetical protein [Stylosanthes scabra]